MDITFSYFTQAKHDVNRISAVSSVRFLFVSLPRHHDAIHGGRDIGVCAVQEFCNR